MKKLHRQRDWVTLSEAARHLSITFAEDDPVTVADLKRAALDGQLRLSAYFPNHAYARRGCAVPLSAARRAAGWPRPGEEPYEVVLGTMLNENEVLEFQEQVLTLDDGELYDLPMRGAERLDIESEYQRDTGGPDVTLVHIDGTFVTRGEQWFQLQERWEDHEPLGRGAGEQHRGFFPASGLPKDRVLVVRTEELRRLQDALAEPAPKKANKTAAAMEDKTRGTVMLALAIKFCDHDTEAERGPAARTIADICAELGVKVHSDTVRNHLQQIAQDWEGEPRRPGSKKR